MAQADTQLDEVQVQSDALDENPQQTSESTEALSEQAAGGTLGDYLDNQPNIDSASYGPGVGRPVVRGMTGYRVKILQNDTEVSDMSAMSQDHAVAVMPKASERIELLKGPASVLYGANAGGIVRVVDDLDKDIVDPGIHGKLEASASDNNDARNVGGRLQAASDSVSLQVSGFRSQTQDYLDGNGNRVKGSDVLSEQGQLALGWRYRQSGQVQLSYTDLHKDYGIPNRTSVPTRIDMRNKVYGLNWSETDVSELIEELKFEVHYSDYTHDETVGSRKDGLYGQTTTDVSLRADYAWEEWSGSTLLSFQDQDLQVCHEHGACETFTKAIRTGNGLGASLEGYLNSRGLPYSHGHPMPDTRTKTSQMGWQGERAVPGLWSQYAAVFSLGAHLEYRQLDVNPDNIQETWVVPASVDPNYYDAQHDWAGSVSAGWEQPTSEHAKWSVNLSYLQRLPSADELFWNGIHHATDSYIFGNPNLSKETSVNLDVDWVWAHAAGELRVNGFYYAFNDYIYQENRYDSNGQPVLDPFHLSPVWQTKQADANFYGASLAYDWKMVHINKTPLLLEQQWDGLSAKLASGGNLPRTAPMNYRIGLVYEPDDWSAKLHWKHVFEANQTAENEPSTAGYNWVTLYADWRPKTRMGDWRLWLKGENLLDEYAQNHLSFLKDTAPLKGRTFSAGLSLNF